MDEQRLRELLEQVRRSEVDVDEALQAFRRLPFENLNFARLDSHRTLRAGFPEVILCTGKHPDHLVEIMLRLASREEPVLFTRATPQIYQALREAMPEVRYNELGRTVVYEPLPLPKRPGTILVITAGTSDIPVAEEAAETAELMGNLVDRLYDVGVAGIHRLLSHIERIQNASVLIVIAGMEGALPSVVGGLVRRPVIAVPTSVGYGASFGGLAALLGMLNSCAAGVTVVNIDNGFGAGYAASLMNRLVEDQENVRIESRVNEKS
jgi:pyridinium-3,5-biscarboxylic acid mononucleotide synthase